MHPHCRRFRVLYKCSNQRRDREKKSSNKVSALIYKNQNTLKFTFISMTGITILLSLHYMEYAHRQKKKKNDNKEIRRKL